ncbi:ligand-binding sensor domain-containing protein [Niabella ginsengisoli]|uniref:Hybrid sensor histidine kinase/response regulator n=1 Tax=Niabella ginsengisoli TaxID=522298 RepID=A0ABS9SIQ1_9BACT|nr:two-component regulator propeller domain-containing protein [Niabella ginsengisoli]MCH5598230.1 hypothetical protein [Niabella ginsengisoli]
MIALLRNVLYRIVCSVIAIMLIYQVMAQGNSNLSYKQLSVNQGLSHSDVTSMAQDISGHLWLGTHNGLNKYDGQKITVFKHDSQDPNSLPDNRITVLFADKAGNIWIGTERNGLCFYNSRKETFTKIDQNSAPSPQIWITDIKQDRKGIIWVTTKKGTLFGIVSEVSKSPKIVHKISVAKADMPINISSMLIEDHNKLYLATDKGIYTAYVSEKIIKKSNFTNNNGGIVKLLKDYTNNIWAAKRDGIYKIEGLDNGMLVQPALNKIQIQENIEKIESIFQDKNGTIWVGTLKDGVYRLRPPSPSDNSLTWKVEHPLSHINNYEFTGSFFNIKCFFEDKYGLLWVGTAGGGAIYSNLKNKMFYTISTRLFNGKNLINDTYISSVYSDNGTLWLGTRKGLCVLDVSSGTSKVYLQDKTVNTIYKDTKGVFWIGLAGRIDGLWRIEKSAKGISEPTKFGINDALKLSAQSVTSITEDDAGQLWVSTINGGINIISEDRKSVMHLRTNNHKGLLSNNINNIYNDPLYSYMWISYRDKGLARISLNNGFYGIRNYSHQEKNNKSLSSNFTWAVKRTKDSSLWIATLGGGLNKMIETSKGPVFTHFTVANGLKDNDIEAMEEDTYGNLWLAGYGLTNFNTKTGTSTFYDYTDGLQSNAFKVGSSFKDEFGRLYFGGINGLNYFDPTNIENGNIAPDIVFTGLRVFNKNINVGEEKMSRLYYQML